ncbi:hypothetical protein WJX73_004626 [Symbiochloris irregularis]|uniref:Delta-1-pyrroline-5-carboxylate synthase n=1 Tax=Symbiochloris irregularis TaxID=706552 RepID=A0AAW1PQP8_9CHLO
MPEPFSSRVTRQPSSTRLASAPSQELDEFDENPVEAFGKPHPTREGVRRSRRIVVKVGAAMVTRGRDSRLALGRLGALIEQLETLVRSGRQVIVVTSGAVAVGRQKLRQQQVLNSTPMQMQIRGQHAVSSRGAAAAGQSGLMALYDSMFGMMDLQAAQVLVTSNDFADASFRQNLKATTEDLLNLNVVPIFNENDAISARLQTAQGFIRLSGPMRSSTSEAAARNSPFTDNDGLAALLATELGADLLCLLTDVNGVYFGDPKTTDSRLIHTYCPEAHDKAINLGQGHDGPLKGMTSKVKAAWMAAQQGCRAVIANGKTSDALLQVVAGQLEGTLFDVQAASRKAHQLRQGTYQHPTADHKLTARDIATSARGASRALQSLPSSEREAILERLADNLEAAESEILAENRADVSAAALKINDNLMKRLTMDSLKIKQLADGIRSIARQREPIRKVLSKTEVLDGLVLEKLTCPIGVLLVIFESRPDALPQIAALAIRSGNGLVLKGGKEASRSNAILHKIVVEALEAAAPSVSSKLINLVTTRARIDELLKLDDVIDLVIPRGGNALVSHVQQSTKIPVLGHAEGICHLYVDTLADLDMACQVAVDSKADNPAACNAVEKILVHTDLAKDGRLYQLQQALRDAGITVLGGKRAAEALSLSPAPSDRHEYGSASLTLELVDSMDEAIDHIHEYGSNHTECIVTEDTKAAEEFLSRVDSACVHHNASTRFGDGYRYGLGAEVGVSTSRIHARGPVGVEGLLTTKWVMRGDGHVVDKDKSTNYTFRSLPVEGDEPSTKKMNGVHKEQ